MKQSLSLLELAQTLTAQSAQKQDFVAPARSLGMTDDAAIEGFGAGAAPANRLGHQQLAEYTGIPKAYYDKLLEADKTILAGDVNLWLSRKPETERRMVRTLDGNVRALLSDKYQRIDNHETAEVALHILGKVPGLKIVSSAITESRLYIKAVSDSLQLAVPGSKRVGDLVETGVLITNSEVGLGALSVLPFAHFLVCTNGMVRNKEGLRKAHVGRQIDQSIEGLLSDHTKRLQDEVVLAQVRDVVQACFDRANFQAFIDRLGATTQEHIKGDVVGAVQALGQPTFGLSGGERESVLKHLISGGDLSRFGLMNAITRTAEDIDSYDRATELEAMGFRLIDSDREWAVAANAKQVVEA